MFLVKKCGGRNCDGSTANNFLRQISVNVAWDKIYGEAIVSKSEVDAQLFKYYLEIDLVIYKDTIASNLTMGIMIIAHFVSINKKQTEARTKAVANAAKKNTVFERD